MNIFGVIYLSLYIIVRFYSRGSACTYFSGACINIDANGFSYYTILLSQSTPSDELVATILAIDRGTPPQTSSVNVTLILLDINDFAPMFTESTYSATTVSNAPIGTTLIRVEATDQDGVDNKITYNILVKENSTDIEFNINEDGEIMNKEFFPLLQRNTVSC